LSLYQNAVVGIFAIAAASLVPVAASAADVARGAKIYEDQGCSGCHAPKEILVGPPHCGVVGRKAGTVADFTYSETMLSSGLTWDEATLHEFIGSPLSFLPGTNMGFAGLFDEAERNDLIAYLVKERAADSPDCK
jgi:cytochrome c